MMAAEAEAVVVIKIMTTPRTENKRDLARSQQNENENGP